MTRDEIILSLCGLIMVDGVAEPVLVHPPRAGVDWKREALIEHPMFDHFVDLMQHDHEPHNADTVRAAWSWFQAGFHATIRTLAAQTGPKHPRA